MRNSKPDYTLSHDPNDAPYFDHKLYVLSMRDVGKILYIEDTDRTHYPFLKQWQGMEIDINNQWSVNNGILGLEVVIHKDGRHKMRYMVRVKLAEAKILLESQYRAIGICDERKRILLPLNLPMIDDLLLFYDFKTNTDKYVKENHLYPKAWSIE